MFWSISVEFNYVSIRFYVSMAVNVYLRFCFSMNIQVYYCSEVYHCMFSSPCHVSLRIKFYRYFPAGTELNWKTALNQFG